LVLGFAVGNFCFESIEAHGANCGVGGIETALSELLDQSKWKIRATSRPRHIPRREQSYLGVGDLRAPRVKLATEDIEWGLGIPGAGPEGRADLPFSQPLAVRPFLDDLAPKRNFCAPPKSTHPRLGRSRRFPTLGGADGSLERAPKIVCASRPKVVKPLRGKVGKNGGRKFASLVEIQYRCRFAVAAEAFVREVCRCDDQTHEVLPVDEHYLRVVNLAPDGNYVHAQAWAPAVSERVRIAHETAVNLPEPSLDVRR
jgi:hypothetical protein